MTENCHFISLTPGSTSLTRQNSKAAEQPNFHTLIMTPIHVGNGIWYLALNLRLLNYPQGILADPDLARRYLLKPRYLRPWQKNEEF